MKNSVLSRLGLSNFGDVFFDQKSVKNRFVNYYKSKKIGKKVSNFC